MDLLYCIEGKLLYLFLQHPLLWRSYSLIGSINDVVPKMRGVRAKAIHPFYFIPESEEAADRRVCKTH